MGRTIDELMNSMTATEFQAWGVYYNEEPFGFEREDYHAGLQCMVIANMSGKVIKGDMPLAKFLHNGGNVEEEQVTEEQSFAMLNNILGGKNVKKIGGQDGDN